MPVNKGLLTILACPRDHQTLVEIDDALLCPSGHRYPVVDGVPVMLLSDVRQTRDLVDASLSQAEAQATLW